MIQSITPIGWLIISLFVLFIIGVNVSLFLSFRKKSGSDHWTDRMRRAGEVLRDPWKNENAKISELSEKVNQLRQKSSDKENS
ncbi:MAG: hypothetical protein VB013_10260 [Anaerolineaceae bacterium]|nr:hypothetical protein [Anaerolineaceae bacterium]